jgi:hypothetical protein
MSWSLRGHGLAHAETFGVLTARRFPGCNLGVRGGTGKAVRLCAAALVAFASVSVAAPASAAALCQVDLGAHTLTATAQNGGPLIFKAASGWLSVADVNCIQLNNVNTVFIDMSPFSYARVQFDLSGGAFGPGFTDEGNGSSEIEFQISGMSTGSSVAVLGTDSSDGIGIGQHTDKFAGTTVGQINLNSIADGSLLDPDVTFLYPSFPDKVVVDTKDGFDRVLGTGGGGITGTFTRPIEIATSGGGEDHFVGGSNNDTIEATLGSFVPSSWSGGAGADVLKFEGSGGTSASLTMDDVANDGIDCPGVSCAGANVSSDFEHVIGGGANETIVGTPNADVLEGGGGTNVLQGGDGNDTLYANQQGIDDFSGGAGRDTVSFLNYSLGYGTTVTQDNVANDGLVGHLTSNVRSDNEIVIGTSAADAITGSGGRNVLYGGSGNDQLSGLGGRDTLYPMGNDDSSNGGSGADTLRFDTSVLPITLSATAGTASGDGSDTFSSVEKIVGSQGADNFFGSANKDTFLGAGGNDTLKGAAGDDVLKGQAGDDSIDGGDGTDTCSQGAGAGTIVNCEL